MLSEYLNDQTMSRDEIPFLMKLRGGHWRECLWTQFLRMNQIFLRVVYFLYLTDFLKITKSWNWFWQIYKFSIAVLCVLISSFFSAWQSNWWKIQNSPQLAMIACFHSYQCCLRNFHRQHWWLENQLSQLIGLKFWVFYWFDLVWHCTNKLRCVLKKYITFKKDLVGIPIVF